MHFLLLSESPPDDKFKNNLYLWDLNLLHTLTSEAKGSN